MPTVTLTRQQLYDRAWTTRSTRLGGNAVCQDGAGGKLREQHDIPVPPRGWSAKKAAGLRVKQTPLPTAKPGMATKLTFAGPESLDTPSRPRPEDHPLVLTERQAENTITVPEDLALTQPLVLKTQRLLNRGKRDSGGLI